MSVFRELYNDVVLAKATQAKCLNLTTSWVEEDTYESAVVNRFSWDKLNLEQNRPEVYLYHRGLCGGFRDGDANVIYPAFPCGKLRPDGYYTQYTLIAMDGTIFIKDFEDIVLLKNNPANIPSRDIVKFYCDKMESIFRMIDNLIHRAKAGNIIECSDEPTMKKIQSVNLAVDSNQTILTLLGEGLNTKFERVNLFDNRETDIISWWAIFEKYKNELLTTFGFNNVGYEKHERLLVDEVTANNDVILNGFFGTMLDCRKEFCERYNNKFGTDISCKANQRLVITNKDKINDGQPQEPQMQTEEVN